MLTRRKPSLNPLRRMDAEVTMPSCGCVTPGFKLNRFRKSRPLSGNSVNCRVVTTCPIVALSDWTSDAYSWTVTDSDASPTGRFRFDANGLVDADRHRFDDDPLETGMLAGDRVDSRRHARHKIVSRSVGHQARPDVGLRVGYGDRGLRNRRAGGIANQADQRARGSLSGKRPACEREYK